VKKRKVFVLWVMFFVPIDASTAWMTVFVHGIMSIKPHLTSANFFRFMSDRVENTVYSKTVRLMREDLFFRKAQAMQGFGLEKIDVNVQNDSFGASAAAHTFEAVWQLMNNGNNIKNYYYTFGWSALLSHKSRYKEAILFYKDLQAEVTRLKKLHDEVKVRLIGYSHGGNVCLNLAKVKTDEDVDPSLSVDELILIGLPVQRNTDYLVTDSLFKKIYHIYSRHDRIQKLDFFSPKQFFSSRVFTKRKDFVLPDNLIQIQLKLTRNTFFSRKTRFNPYGFDKPSMIYGGFHFLRNVSPGHLELWFFGWNSAHYRKTLPIYPLPAVVFTPAIIRAVDSFTKGGLFFEDPIVVDIRPQHEVMLVKSQGAEQHVSVVHFLPQERLNVLKDEASCFAQTSTRKEHHKHISVAYKKAKKMHRSQTKNRRYRRRRRSKKV
jgi:hypothetical protein